MTWLCNFVSPLLFGIFLMATPTTPAMEEEDLYGDLDAVSERVSPEDLCSRLAESEAERLKLRTALDMAATEKKKLAEANEVLAQNISVLFNTAKAEIDRKTRNIERLEKELADVLRERSRS